MSTGIKVTRALHIANEQHFIRPAYNEQQSGELKILRHRNGCSAEAVIE
jgi:hypothetical protein